MFLNARDDESSLMEGPVLHLVELHFLMAGTDAFPAILEDVRNVQLAYPDCVRLPEKSLHTHTINVYNPIATPFILNLTMQIGKHMLEGAVQTRREICLR